MDITKPQILKICKKLKTELIEYRFLSRGNHNENYLIHTKKGRFVLRIENNHQFSNLKTEYQFLKRINGKFAPKVYLFDSTKKIIKKHYLIEEFIYGKTPKKITLPIINKAARFYKQIHKTKSKHLPKYIKKHKYYSLIESFNYHALANFRKHKDVLPKAIIKKLKPLYDETKIIIKENEEIFAKRKLFSLNHGDPSRRNIFIHNNEFKMIDWEFVSYTLPEWDLAFFIWAHELNKSQTKIFLRAYDYSTSETAIKKLRIIYLLLAEAMINWRIKRLYLVKNKKVDKRQSQSTKSDILKRMKEDIKRVKKILENF
jgi:aminoglycoside phosphotransferase (APT) family kinase protein